MKKAGKMTVLIILMVFTILLPAGAQARGDVNNDNAIDIVDALLSAQYYVGLNPGGFYSQAADVNCDAAIDIIDALMIAQYYVGLLPNFPDCAGTTKNTLTIEISGRDLSINPIDIPYINPPDLKMSINSKFVYEKGTIVNLYLLSSTPPPTPPSGSYPVEYQTASFEGYGTSAAITLDNDIMLKIVYQTHVLTPENPAEPTPPMVGDNYFYRSSGDVVVVEPEIPLDYNSGGYIVLDGNIAAGNSYPGYTGDGYVTCEGLPSSISFGLYAPVADISYFEIRMRVWDQAAQSWTFTGYTQPAMFQIAESRKAFVKLSFSNTQYIVDRIIIFPEGTPESDWQDLTRTQSSGWTSVTGVPGGEFLIR